MITISPYEIRLLKLRQSIRAPVPLLATVASAAVILVLFWRTGPQPLLAGWFLLVGAIQLVRTILVRRAVALSDEQLTGPLLHRLSRLSVALLGLIGLVWGSSAMLLYGDHPAELDVVLTLAVVGLAAGVSNLHAVSVRAVAAFCVPSLGSFLLAFLVHATPASHLLAVLLIIFMAVLSLSVRTYNQKYDEVFRLQSANAALVSDLETARDRAERGNESKSRFLADLTHELRTPLNAIIGFCDTMLAEKFGPIDNPRYREFIATIETSGTHLLEMINRLLDHSKMEAGKFVIDYSRFDLSNVVERCVELMRHDAQSRSVALDLSLPPVPVALDGDRVRLRQILLNLISNAIRFTDSGGRVQVVLSEPDAETVRLSVIDTGIGMAAEEVATALMPFTQLASGRSAGGTGLGLPLVKALAELHGGRLDIVSAPGRGTEASVTLPRRALAEASAA